MGINSIDELKKVQEHIRVIIQRYNLESVLLSLRESAQQSQVSHDFITATISLFAFRYCTGGHKTKTVHALKREKLQELIALVGQYALADPITFDQVLRQDYYDSNPTLTMLRMVGSQFPYNFAPFGHYTRPLVLFHEIPQQLKLRTDIEQFDIESSFQKLTGISIVDFIKVGFIAFAGASQHHAFTRDYFEVARAQGISIPKDEELLPIINQLAADPKQLRAVYNRYRTTDERFSMYDFNPLFVYPIVRPWRQKGTISMSNDRMISPLPHLITFRISTGIYYQIFNTYKTEFSKYFGYVFEAYIGKILQEVQHSWTLFSENDIRQTYPEKAGKVPDWVIIEGNTAILIECKATRFSRAALATGEEEKINDSLKQVLKGLRQLSSFQKACLSKHPQLQQFHKITEIKPILLTAEPLYLVNNIFFRQHIEELLSSKGVHDLTWHILSVDQLEELQPHFTAGVNFGKTIDKLEHATFESVLREVSCQTGKTYRDSFLHKAEEFLDQQLGIAHKS